MFLDIYNKIKEYDTIIIHRHNRPDGDALGSQLGLKFAILETFPSKCVKVVGDMIERYSFMGVMDEISDELYSGALVIVCDCGTEKLISDDRYNKGDYLIKIDHHIPQGEYGDIMCVDTSYESCCGLITKLIMETPLVMNKNSANSLFVGLVTDSGRFRYSQTTANTFNIASYLMNYDVDTEYIYNKIYTEKLENVKLRAKMVSKFNVTEYGVAYLVNTKEEVASYGLSIFDVSRGMVNIMGGIEGIDVWANFTEDVSGDIYCEFRSNGANVNSVAVKFGGGGHLQASGCTIKNLSDIDKVIDELNKLVGDKND